MAYRIVTDATADLSMNMLENLPTLTIVPMTVECEGVSYTYGPSGDIDAKKFYELQRQGNFFKTTSVNPRCYVEIFEPLLELGLDILYICFTSGMSGCYSNALLAVSQLKEKYPQRQIIVVDSLCASVGEGFLVAEALRMQANNVMLEDLALWVDTQKKNVCHWFTVDTFEHLKHGGRVSATSAVMGTLLQIKPLLRVDEQGSLEVMAKPRGRKNAMKAQLQHMMNTLQDPHRILIGHGDNPEAAQDLAFAVLEQVSDAQIYIAEIGPVIGSHTGPGMLALIFWGSER